MTSSWWNQLIWLIGSPIVHKSTVNLSCSVEVFKIWSDDVTWVQDHFYFTLMQLFLADKEDAACRWDWATHRGIKTVRKCLSIYDCKACLVMHLTIFRNFCFLSYSIFHSCLRILLHNTQFFEHSETCQLIWVFYLDIIELDYRGAACLKYVHLIF